MQNLCKLVKYSLLNSLQGYTSAGRCAVAQIDTHVSHPADKYVPDFNFIEL